MNAFVCIFSYYCIALYCDHLAKLEELHCTEFPALHDCGLQWAPREIYMLFERQEWRSSNFFFKSKVSVVPGTIVIYKCCVSAGWPWCGQQPGPRLHLISSSSQNSGPVACTVGASLLEWWKTGTFPVHPGGFQSARMLYFFTSISLPDLT